MSCSQSPVRQAEACNLQIDYSTVQGARILPFVIALDVAASELNPAPGERQRFCYRITGVGDNDSEYADLSHMVMGICDRIRLQDLQNVSVVINGVPQQVILGDNVEIRTEVNPDPPTGCPGLKIDFPLNKFSGVMQLCFELDDVYEIGPVPVCLYGGAVTADGLSVCGPICGSENRCTAMGYQTANVCLPVTVTPYARPGTPRTYCCGTPIVTPGVSVCPGERMGSCAFTVSQQICVAVPVEFGADILLGEHSVECLGASEDEPQPVRASAFCVGNARRSRNAHCDENTQRNTNGHCNENAQRDGNACRHETVQCNGNVRWDESAQRNGNAHHDGNAQRDGNHAHRCR